jgi:hypothetical protein
LPLVRTSKSKDTSNSMILVPLLNPKFALGLGGNGCGNFGFGALDYHYLGTDLHAPVEIDDVPPPRLPRVACGYCAATRAAW